MLITQIPLNAILKLDECEPEWPEPLTYNLGS